MENRKPSHPGSILSNSYLKPLKMSVTDLAKNIGVSRRTLSMIINGRRSISIDMAGKLAKTFNTTIYLWLNLQLKYDVFIAAKKANNWNNIPTLYKGCE